MEKDHILIRVGSRLAATGLEALRVQVGLVSTIDEAEQVRQAARDIATEAMKIGDAASRRQDALVKS